MVFQILPTRTGGAAENMAIDFLLLQRYPQSAAPRFRHYGWHRPAFTFGYGQKIAFVREQLCERPPGAPDFDFCRRPTGGGIVDHRDDWTYALVIPRGHPLEDVRATQSYRAVHEALAAALREQGVPAVIKAAPDDADESQGELVRLPAPAVGAEGVCFERAEIHDVVHEQSAEKIAGAAQKRNKHGLLFQGSIWRPSVVQDSTFDWEGFEEGFVARLAAALATTAEPVPWPDFNEDEISGLTERYASPEWLAYR